MEKEMHCRIEIRYNGRRPAYREDFVTQVKKVMMPEEKRRELLRPFRMLSRPPRATETWFTTDGIARYGAAIDEITAFINQIPGYEVYAATKKLEPESKMYSDEHQTSYFLHHEGLFFKLLESVKSIIPVEAVSKI